MTEMKRRFRHHAGSAGFALAALCVLCTPAFAQGSYAPGPGKVPGNVVGDFDKIHELPPGGPAPRTVDGHVDLTGRWYPNAAGKMLQLAYPLDPAVFQQFDPKATPEEAPSFKPGMAAKYKRRSALWRVRSSRHSKHHHRTAQPARSHGAVSSRREIGHAGRVPHGYPHYPYRWTAALQGSGSTFNGDSVAHWDGNTLVIDVIAIDERLANGLGGGMPGGPWFHSDQEHVVERLTRPSKNFLIYEVTIEDPVVLAKPWKSAPRRWSLAGPDDDWGEVFVPITRSHRKFRKFKAPRRSSKRRPYLRSPSVSQFAVARGCPSGFCWGPEAFSVSDLC